MNSLFRFLTGQEAMLVYMVAILSCILCTVIYIVEKSSHKLRKRYNTRELNKLVEEVQEKEPTFMEENPVYYPPVAPPVLEVSSPSVSSSVVDENLDTVEESETLEESNEKVELSSTEALADDFITSSVEDNSDGLEYTTIEPDSATAQLELLRFKEELEKEAERQSLENEGMTSFEESQEENAIISLDEWLQKSKKMYEANEVTQYDEGNAPISLHELEEKAGRKADPLEDTFILENVVNSDEVEKEALEEEKKFQTSPIISPVFGIKKEENQYNDMQFENTATYDKLDLETKKTNEFLMTLKELQEKLE